MAVTNRFLRDSPLRAEPKELKDPPILFVCLTINSSILFSNSTSKALYLAHKKPSFPTQALIPPGPTRMSRAPHHRGGGAAALLRAILVVQVRAGGAISLPFSLSDSQFPPCLILEYGCRHSACPEQGSADM